MVRQGLARSQRGLTSRASPWAALCSVTPLRPLPRGRPPCLPTHGPHCYSPGDEEWPVSRLRRARPRGDRHQQGTEGVDWSELAPLLPRTPRMPLQGRTPHIPARTQSQPIAALWSKTGMEHLPCPLLNESHLGCDRDVESPGTVDLASQRRKELHQSFLQQPPNMAPGSVGPLSWELPRPEPCPVDSTAPSRLGRGSAEVGRATADTGQRAGILQSL